MSVLPFPTGHIHSSAEDAVSVEYKMALLNCLVMRVGFMVTCAFLTSPHSVLKHTFLTQFVGFKGEIHGHNFIVFVLSSVAHTEIGPVIMAC